MPERMNEFKTKHDLADLQLTVVHTTTESTTTDDDEPLYLIKQTNQACRVCFKGVFISFALFRCCRHRRRLPANRNPIQTLFACIRVAIFFFVAVVNPFGIEFRIFFHTRFPDQLVDEQHIPVWLAGWLAGFC